MEFPETVVKVKTTEELIPIGTKYRQFFEVKDANKKTALLKVVDFFRECTEKIRASVPNVRTADYMESLQTTLSVRVVQQRLLLSYMDKLRLFINQLLFDPNYLPYILAMETALHDTRHHHGYLDATHELFITQHYYFARLPVNLDLFEYLFDLDLTKIIEVGAGIGLLASILQNLYRARCGMRLSTGMPMIHLFDDKSWEKTRDTGYPPVIPFTTITKGSYTDIEKIDTHPPNRSLLMLLWSPSHDPLAYQSLVKFRGITFSIPEKVVTDWLPTTTSSNFCIFNGRIFNRSSKTTYEKFIRRTTSTNVEKGSSRQQDQK
jgi:hypothetical protein